MAAGGTVLLHVVDPNQPGHYPLCPLYALTGWYCPGCGALRAVHDLSVGDLAGAWMMNPLLVLSVPYLVGVWIAAVQRSATGRPRRWVAPGWLVLSVAIALTLFGVLRNVPALSFLAPH
ncbi:hypothetical protein SDC9_196159 [bioreactor metagenome]|uniref:DUF2752 domain-containing protein n=1 Tax=bioreactor metagenome TaxID=1076179 RepID=A0A645IDL1_9ZZZZ